MNKEQFLQSGLLEQYVLGLTSPEEDQLVQHFLDTYPEVRDMEAQYRRQMDDYAVEQLSIDGGQHRMAQVAQVQDMPAIYRWMPLLAAILAFAVVSLHRSNDSLKYKLQQKEAEYAALEIFCQQNSDKTQHKYAWAKFIHDPHTRMYALNCQLNAGDKLAVAYWNADQQHACIDPHNLPVLPKDSAYQVWVDVKGEMKHAGLITHPLHDDMVELVYHKEAESINITVEPRDGSTHPTLSSLIASVYIK
ncbi:MAG: anti-sigma factor [Saprospiraceae bacterium]